MISKNLFFFQTSAIIDARFAFSFLYFTFYYICFYTIAIYLLLTLIYITVKICNDSYSQNKSFLKVDLLKLSKYAIIIAHEVNAVREPSIAEKS